VRGGKRAASRSPPVVLCSGVPTRSRWRRYLNGPYSAPIGAVSTSTLDRTFFALSDPTRRNILKRLARGPATIGELAAPFGLTLNGVKKHVGILEEVDLVSTTKVGRARECHLGPAELHDVTRWIHSYRRALERRLESFSAYVEARAASDG
jgi:DNA-binding transcriptional ArsR family regulator